MYFNRYAGAVVALLFTVLLAGCASGPERPIFYQSSYEAPVDQARADRDIDDCMAAARRAGVSEQRDGEIGKKSASGALIGGVAAGAWGLVRGDAGERLLAGAVAGGATGATKGAIDSTKMNPTFKRYVERCLRDLGYEVIGWE